MKKLTKHDMVQNLFEMKTKQNKKKNKTKQNQTNKQTKQNKNKQTKNTTSNKYKHLFLRFYSLHVISSP